MQIPVCVHLSDQTYKETQKKSTNSHSSEEQTNTSRRGEGCEERYDDHLRTSLSSTSSRNDVTGHHRSDERRRSNYRDGRRHSPTSSRRHIVHVASSRFDLLAHLCSCLSLTPRSDLLSVQFPLSFDVKSLSFFECSFSTC
jgi:hypothetical protein